MVLDCAVFALLGGALFAFRRIRPPAAGDLQGAFQELERSIGKFVPDMPSGFTWGEAVERLRGDGDGLDWPKIESAVTEYEAFRYGGRDMPKGGTEEVVKLSTRIRRRVVGHRN